MPYPPKHLNNQKRKSHLINVSSFINVLNTPSLVLDALKPIPSPDHKMRIAGARVITLDVGVQII
jgi:hypothetical protein